jgi:hypothetical protein
MAVSRVVLSFLFFFLYCILACCDSPPPFARNVVVTMVGGELEEMAGGQEGRGHGGMAHGWFVLLQRGHEGTGCARGQNETHDYIHIPQYQARPLAGRLALMNKNITIRVVTTTIAWRDGD